MTFLIYSPNGLYRAWLTHSFYKNIILLETLSASLLLNLTDMGELKKFT